MTGWSGSRSSFRGPDPDELWGRSFIGAPSPRILLSLRIPSLFACSWRKGWSHVSENFFDGWQCWNVSEQLFSTKLTINGLWLTDPAIGNIHVRTIKLLLAENIPLLHSILHDRIRQGLLEDHAYVEDEGMRRSWLFWGLRGTSTWLTSMPGWQSVFLFPAARRIVGEINSQIFFGAVLSKSLTATR